MPRAPNDQVRNRYQYKTGGIDLLIGKFGRKGHRKAGSLSCWIGPRGDRTFELGCKRYYQLHTQTISSGCGIEVRSISCALVAYGQFKSSMSGGLKSNQNVASSMFCGVGDELVHNQSDRLNLCRRKNSLHAFHVD